MICEIQILGAYDEGEACDASFKDFLRQFGWHLEFHKVLTDGSARVMLLVVQDVFCVQIGVFKGREHPNVRKQKLLTC